MIITADWRNSCWRGTLKDFLWMRVMENGWGSKWSTEPRWRKHVLHSEGRKWIKKTWIPEVSGNYCCLFVEKIQRKAVLTSLLKISLPISVNSIVYLYWTLNNLSDALTSSVLTTRFQLGLRKSPKIFHWGCSIFVDCCHKIIHWYGGTKCLKMVMEGVSNVHIQALIEQATVLQFKTNQSDFKEVISQPT